MLGLASWRSKKSEKPSAQPPPLPKDAADADVVDVEAAGAVDVAELPRRLRSVFADPSYKPPTPPAVAMELMALTRKGEVDVKAAAKLFAKDPMLMAKVLKVARSPLYGAAHIPTINDAIIRLGTRRLNHVVLEAALDMRVFRSEVFGPWMERARRHSVAVGHIASHLAWVGCVDADQALIAGLMHDVGIAAALSAVADRRDRFKDIDDEAFAAALDDIHAEVGGMVADVWQLADDIQRVIKNHHNVMKKRDDSDSAMLAVIVLAEAFANDAGYSAGQADLRHASDIAWAKRTLDVDDGQMAQLAKDLAPVLYRLG